jgi:hypothetical protein
MAFRQPSLGLRGHGFDESIPLPRHRLNVSRARALIAKDRSEAADDDVKAVIEVDVPIGPQPALDLVTRDQLAGPLEQQTEHIDGLSAEPHGCPPAIRRRRRSSNWKSPNVFTTAALQF